MSDSTDSNLTNTGPSAVATHGGVAAGAGGGVFTAAIHNDDQRYAYSALGGQSGVVRWFVRAVDKLGNESKSEERVTQIEYCLGL